MTGKSFVNKSKNKHFSLTGNPIQHDAVLPVQSHDHEEAEAKLEKLVNDLAQVKSELRKERTERKLLQKKLFKAEKHHCLMFNEMISGFALHEIICDTYGKPCDYRFLDANPAFEKLTGLKVENIVGKRVLEVLPDLEPHWIDIYGKVALGGKPIRFENYSEELDRYFDVTAYSNELGKFAVIFNDITELKRAEEEVIKSSEKIKLFAYSVSHDLKNPALAVHGLTRLLHKKYGQLLDEQGKKHCDLILKSAEQIIGLLDRINTFISTKELPMSIERVDLQDVLTSIKEEYFPKLLSREIRFSMPKKLPAIFADKSSLFRVIRNLVDNSLKYGGDNLGEISIWHKETENFHILCVKDDGVGLSKDDLQAIFTPFQRKKTSKGVKGTGLGLAIVKEIAGQHKGKVWIEDDPSAGSTFCMSISKKLAA